MTQLASIDSSGISVGSGNSRDLHSSYASESFRASSDTSITDTSASQSYSSSSANSSKESESEGTRAVNRGRRRNLGISDSTFNFQTESASSVRTGVAADLNYDENSDQFDSARTKSRTRIRDA